MCVCAVWWSGGELCRGAGGGGGTGRYVARTTETDKATCKTSE